MSDFDYERQMALTNRHLHPALETVFLMPSPRFTHVSSTLVRDIAALGGSLAGLVPPVVIDRLHQTPGSRNERIGYDAPTRFVSPNARATSACRRR